MDTIMSILSGKIPPGIYVATNTLPVEERLLAERKYRFFHIDGSQVFSKVDFLKHAAKAMNFPGYFGHNWDAFDECLTDLGWAPANGYLVLYTCFEAFANKSPSDFEVAIGCLIDAVQYWEQTSSPMVVLLHGVGSPPPLSTLPTI